MWWQEVLRELWLVLVLLAVALTALLLVKLYGRIAEAEAARKEATDGFGILEVECLGYGSDGCFLVLTHRGEYHGIISLNVLTEGPDRWRILYKMSLFSGMNDRDDGRVATFLPPEVAKQVAKRQYGLPLGSLVLALNEAEAGLAEKN